MKKLTDITIVLDRSGSMESIREKTIDGFNAFLKDQKTLKDQAVFTLFQFDHEFETVYEALDIKEVPPLTINSFVPRGMTALLDAIGKGIKETKQRINISEPDASRRVIFVLITDGYENNSRIYSRKNIFDKISRMEKKHHWEFVYLGANQDAISEATSMGIQAKKAMTFLANDKCVEKAFSSVSKNMASLRQSDILFAFSDDQRLEQQEEISDPDLTSVSDN
jgi:hypothetical protein